MIVILFVLALLCFWSALNAGMHAVYSLFSGSAAATVICAVGAAFWGFMGVLCVRGMRA